MKVASEAATKYNIQQTTTKGQSALKRGKRLVRQKKQRPFKENVKIANFPLKTTLTQSSSSTLTRNTAVFTEIHLIDTFLIVSIGPWVYWS